MATRNETTAFVLEQLAAAGEVSARKMFGEVGLYCDGKFVGVICDDELYFKITDEGLAFAPDLPHAPPYKGARDYLHVEGDRLEDADWVTQLLQITTAALPAPKPKKPKAKKAAKKAR